MFYDALGEWPPDEGCLPGAPSCESDPLSGSGSEPTWEPRPDWPVEGPAMVAPDAPRLHEIAASGFGAWELDWATTDPTRICDRDVLDGIVGLDRVVAWAQARQTRLLAEFLTRRGDTPAATNETRPSPNSRFAPDELGIALRISRGAAAGRLGEALFLVEQLPEVLDLWATGRLDGFKVRIIADTVVFLDPDKATAVVARVLPKAPEQSHGQLRAALAKAILAVDPKGANDRHRKARRDRRVSVNAQPEGMASLWAYLSAPDARAAWEWLTRLARGLDTDDPRKMDARRADLLVALLTGKITFTNPDDPDTGETVTQNAPATAADPSGSEPGNVGQVADPGSDPGAADPTAADPGRGGPGAADPATDLGSVVPDPAEPSAADPWAGLGSANIGATADAGAAGAAGAARDTATAGHAVTAQPDDPAPTGTGTGTGTGTRAVRQPVQRARMRSATTTTPLPTPDDPPNPAPTDPAPTDPPRPTRERINPVTPGKPLITVAVAYTTLTGADELPGHLAGYGPIPADLAREIAADAVWKRLLYDPPSGTILDFGRTTYHPPVGLADHVRARDLICRGPRCPKPASAAELDHHIPYPDGPTSEPNLSSLCKQHHDLKGDGSWNVTRQPDGSLTWTTPTGHTHTTHPHDYRPDPIDLEHGLPEPRSEITPPPTEPDDDPPPF